MVSSDQKCTGEQSEGCDVYKTPLNINGMHVGSYSCTVRTKSLSCDPTIDSECPGVQSARK